jgi:hypothetical protein
LIEGVVLIERLIKSNSLSASSGTGPAETPLPLRMPLRRAKAVTEALRTWLERMME